MKNRLLLGLLVTSSAFPALSAPPPPPHRAEYKPALILQWKDRLHAANVRLQASDWKKGRDIADSVIREMRDRIASGEASGDLLAVALLFRAIGQAGLNEGNAAAWDFGTAQALYPPYERVDLKPYGTAGELLDKHRYTNGASSEPGRWPPPTAEPGAQVSPPRKLRGGAPEYPLAKAVSCIQAPVIVRTVINEQGHPESPSLPDQTDPILALAACDAVRNWRFRPAELDGKPVPVLFLLTVNFKVRHCA